MHRTPHTIRLLGLAVVAVLSVASSGCSVIDRLFLLNADGPYGHHGGHGECHDCPSEGCPPEGCPDGRCQAGGCKDCPDGTCHVPHTGRYGGLAKHHLSADERAALAASDYGAVTPAGPPTGAVAYPYYTTRGPRDFLAKNPASIGP